MAGRTIAGIEQGNRLLAHFITEIAHARPHPTIAQRTVGEVLAVERARLLPLPVPLLETARVEPIKADSQAFVHLDTNRYSVPSDYMLRVVTLVTDDRTVRFLDGDTCHLVEILGESWRDKHRLDPDRPPPPPSRSRRKRT